MVNEKIPLYTKKTLQYNGNGWDGILKPLNDFYQSNDLHYFLFPHQIKEKFGGLRISVGPYNFYTDLVQNKTLAEIEKINLDFSNFGEYEKTYYKLSKEFNSQAMGEEIMKNIKPKEMHFFLKQQFLFGKDERYNEEYKNLIKEILSNSLNALSQSGEYIRDFGALKQKLNSF